MTAPYMEPIVLMVEDEMSPEEVILVVHHLMSQGFLVEILSTDPLTLQLTVPANVEYAS